MGESVDEDVSGVTIRWKDVRCTVKKGKKTKIVLDDISGMAVPGEVVAILGPSGSGKTTLLDILAGRVRGGSCWFGGGMKVSGSISFNQVSLQKVTRHGIIPHLMSYITQEDALQTRFTAIETLRHAADLYLTLPAEEREAVVQKILDDTGLRDCQVSLII